MEGRDDWADIVPSARLPADGKTMQPCSSQQGGDGQDMAISRYPWKAAFLPLGCWMADGAVGAGAGGQDKMDTSELLRQQTQVPKGCRASMLG